MAVQVEMLLPKDREVALDVVARRLALAARTPNKPPSLLTSTTMDQSPPLTLVPWLTPLVLPTTAPRI